MADEVSGLVPLFQHQAGALDALIGDRLLGVRERQRLGIFLAEIDHAHIFLGFGIGCRGRWSGGRRRIGGGTVRRGRGLGSGLTGGRSGRGFGRLGQSRSKPG